MAVFATWDALAGAIGLEPRELHRARKLPGAPESKDGTEWREFLASASRLDTEGLPATSYDSALKSGRVDTDSALKHSRIVEQEIVNEIKREELRKLRADVVSKEGVRSKVEKITQACIDAISSLPDMYAETLKPDERAEGRKLAKTWVEAIRTRMSEKVKSPVDPGV